MVCHRRAGKTVAAVCELIIRALYTQKENARYGYVAPYREQAKDIAWEYLKHYGRDFAEPKGVRESELRIKLFNGAWITLYGSDNPDALRGRYLDGVVLDEYGDCRPGVWGEVIRPTLADRMGWGLFIGTYKGKNHFFRVAEGAKKNPRWYRLILKASESGILPPEELEDLKLELSDEEYEQEMECNPNASIRGTYYAEQIAEMEKKGLIAPLDLYNDNELVQVAADLGYKDSTALWFWQDTKDGPVLIDYREASGMKPDYYFELLDNLPYKYEDIWLPHDAKAETLSTSRSTLEQFQEHFKHQGVRIRKTPKLTKQQGIDALRLALKFTRIDSRKCADGIEALRAYARKFDSLNNIFLDHPHHNWASDGADAARYFALVCRLPSGELGRQILEARKKSDSRIALPGEKAIITPFTPEKMTLNGLFAMNEKTSGPRHMKLRL